VNFLAKKSIIYSPNARAAPTEIAKTMLKLISLTSALTIILGAMIAACSSEPTCDYSKAPYIEAKSVAPLRAPKGLSTPDRSAALVIPPEPATKAAPLGKGRCLDRPPSYFSTTPKTDSPKPEVPKSENPKTENKAEK
jgi:hypothetical protein